MMDWLLFDDGAREAARALSGVDAAVEPCSINNPSHAYAGAYALPASIIAAPGYERWEAQLSALPVFTASVDELFLPAEL